MKNSILFLVVLSIAIAGGVGLFYFQSRLPNNELINQDVNGQLLKVDAMDANINELALRSRANLDGNYDMLVRSTVALERTIADLSNSYFKPAEIAGSLLDTRFNGFKTSMEIKIDQVENFKSFNSVLRNSEKYIPLIGAELTNVAQANEQPQVSDLYKQIVIDMFEFTKQGSNKRPDEVIDFNAMIRATENVMPEEYGIKVLEFANHVATAVDAKQKTDQYLSKVLNTSADDQIGEISSAWGLWQADKNSTQETLGYYTLAYVLTMLALIGVLVYRLRNVYTNLDKEVEAKTMEVKEAYEELQDSERQLVQSEKMASLGQLVAGVAHEINTPLSYITSNLETIKGKFDRLAPVLVKVEAVSEHVADPNRDKSELSGLLKEQIVAYRSIGKNNAPENINILIDDADEGLQEIKDIVDSLTSFSHVQDAPIQEVDVNERIESCLKVAAKVVAERKVTAELGSKLPPVSGVPNQLAQVFSNIINNAVHATKSDSGKLTIKSELVNDKVKVTFKDNGRGIDGDSLKRVFEPFFTTKEVGEGTGLGLSIAHRIIESHKGELEVESEEGSGTTVIVKLPIVGS